VEDAQAVEGARQLVDLVAEGPAASDLGAILVEALHYDDAAGLEARADLVGVGGHELVHEQTAHQVPLLAAEVELGNALQHGVELEAQLGRVLLGDADTLLGDVHAGDIPSLLGEEDRVAALSHADVERLAGLAALDGLDQEGVRLPIEVRVGGREGLVPTLLVGRRQGLRLSRGLGQHGGRRQQPGE
jgi:hypothetical protein